MFKKILIANRGEIALRVIRTCKEMGIKTVAVYSKADEESLHVRFADEAVCIGPAPSSESYLKIPNIIAAAEITNADAIHPGYGFLSENAKFSKICSEHKIKFIGPSPEMIEKMGDKATAVSTMNLAKVPTIPGSGGAVEKEDEAIKIASKIGFPVMVKASAGGGGKGMRAVWSKADFKKSWSSAKQEASAAFGNDDMYIEKLIQEPRHIEIQIIADQFGNVCHLSERDCSIQRRHQKLTEETPSPFMTSKLRDRMGEAAVKAAKFINYEGVGTVEFLVDKNRNFYFMEMNTRIQVEHPVTEQRTGIDLIKEQIKVAMDEKLNIEQKDIEFHGHCIECRINAENPKTNAPSPGKIVHYHRPGGLGVRVDDFIYTGYTVLPFYDSMISKVIVNGKNREECLLRMKRALEETVIEGINTNKSLHLKIISDEDFIGNNYSTNFLKNKMF